MTTISYQNVDIDETGDDDIRYPKIMKKEVQSIDNGNGNNSGETKDVEKTPENEEHVHLVVEEDEKTVSPREDMDDEPKQVVAVDNGGDDDDNTVLGSGITISAPVPIGLQSQCCKSFVDSLKKFPPLYWYLAPATFDIAYSFSCLFYHFFHFILAVAIWTFLVAAVTTSVTMIIVACIGIPLLYLTFEILLVLTRMNFTMAYYMVERDPLLLTTDKWKVALKVDNRHLPGCMTWCESGGRLDRMKFLLTSCNLYVQVLYYLLVAPVATFLLSASVIPLLQVFELLILPFWYAADSSYFKDRKACYYGNKQCSHGWLINSVEDVILIFLVGLLMLPLAFRLVNVTAEAMKRLTYLVFTDYYTKRTKGITASKSLLSGDNNDNNKYGDHGSLNTTLAIDEEKPIQSGDNSGILDPSEKSLYDDL